MPSGDDTDGVSGNPMTIWKRQLLFFPAPPPIILPMTNALKHLLVVDDDQRLRTLLLRYLKSEGFLVSTAKSVAEAREALWLFTFDALILDIMMPHEKGVVLLEEVTAQKKNNSTRMLPELPPILFLTAMGEAKDRVQGLKLGAEDYLVKPFDPQELVLRIHKILRHAPIVSPVIAFGEVVFDKRQEQLQKGLNSIPLTSSELNLLKFLIQNLEKPLQRDFLAEALGEHLNPRTIDVQVNRLRQKIEIDPKSPRYLQTIRGKGYRLRAEA